MTLTTSAQAHPHGWIDLATTVHFDGDGRIVALEETWLFDEAYSAFATYGFDQDGDGMPDPDLLDALTRQTLGDLEPYGYFTRIERNGAELDTLPVERSETQMADGRLEMRFVLPLAEPEPSRGAAIGYAIFDPTYYIEMLHAGGAAAVRLVDAPAGCTVTLVPPSPDPEVIALAAALDRTESAGNELGIQFAERVQVTCAG